MPFTAPFAKSINYVNHSAIPIMKQFLILLLSILSFCGYAQERKNLTTEYQGGTLSFQYYEKDGIKIPDGHMEFTHKYYTEKVEMKDGLRNGLWVIQGSRPKTGTRISSHFKDGMIDGEVVLEGYEYNSKIDKAIPFKRSLQFKNGHLFGENKVVHSSDTIYCNFDENGDRIGIWKYVSPSRIYFTEYTPENQVKGISYEIDILGQKKEFRPLGSYMAFWFFSWNFTRIPDIIRQEALIELPTLSENKYGIVKNLEFPNRDKYDNQ